MKQSFILLSILTLSITGILLSQNYLNQTSNNLRASEDQVSDKDISKVLNHLSYSLNDESLGKTSSERFENSKANLTKQQPGLSKYVNNLQLKNSNQDMALIVNEQTKKSYFAIRGTVPSFKSYRDFYNDAQIALDIIPNRSKTVDEFLSQNAKPLKDQGYQITVTGHSLGGLLSMQACSKNSWVDSCYAHNPGSSPIKSATESIKIGIDKLGRISQDFIGKDLTSLLPQWLKPEISKQGEDPNRVFVELNEGDFISKWGYSLNELDIETTIKQQPDAAIKCGYPSHSSYNYIATLDGFDGNNCLNSQEKIDSLTSNSEMDEIYEQMIENGDLEYEEVELKSDCQEGEYLEKQGKCSPCKEGTTCPEGTITPQCQQGWFFNRSKNMCQYCSAGYYYQGGSECKACPVGYKCPEKTSSPIQCSKGSYNPYTKSSSCYYCPKGYECDYKSKSKCQPGTYAKEGDGVCKNCDSIYYQPYTAASACYICPKGEECDGTSRKKCGPGRYAKEGDGVCKNCDAKYYQPYSNASSCYICPKGEECDGTSHKKCGPGRYAKEGDGVCKSCDAIYYQPYSNASSCYYCPKGEECDGTSHQKCGPGRYAKEGDGVCKSCPSKDYQPYDNSSSCYLCPTDHTCNGTSSQKCPSGTYSPQGASNCQSRQ